MLILLAAGCLGAGGALLLPLSARLPELGLEAGSPPRTGAPESPHPLPRVLIALLAGVCVWLFFEGVVGLAAGVGASWFGYRALMKAESPAARREREASTRELPMVVGLLVAPLQAGADLQMALSHVVEAFPGPAAQRLAPALARLRVGVSADQVWRELAEDPALGALARALARSEATGAGVVETIDELALELAEAERGAVEDRARQVGVKAAIPLGLCLLPAFLLLGIVPLVAGLIGALL